MAHGQSRTSTLTEEGKREITSEVYERVKRGAVDRDALESMGMAAEHLSSIFRYTCDPLDPQNQLAKLKFFVDLSRLNGAMLQVASTAIGPIIRGSQY